MVYLFIWLFFGLGFLILPTVQFFIPTKLAICLAISESQLRQV